MVGDAPKGTKKYRELASVAVTATTTATAAATSSAAAVTATTATAGWAFFTRPGLVDRQLAALEIFLMKHGNRFGCILL